MADKVILVDENDKKIGEEDKLAAHIKGKLHRAFSVLIFNSAGCLLLQKRAKTKYHTPGLWANTCCSHPRPGEIILNAAERRLKEEMGFSCGLDEKFHFIYRAEFDNGLIEYELDHVFVGKYDGKVLPDPREADEFKWVALEDLKKALRESPHEYVPWLKIILKFI